MSQIVEKVHNILIPQAPQDNVGKFEFAKYCLFHDPPPTRNKIGEKMKDVDIFQMVAPHLFCAM